jgi:hypothetical protein
MLPTPDLLLRTVHRFSPIHTTSTFSDILANGSALLVFVLAVIASDRKGTLRASLRGVVPVAPRPTDTTFHVFALTFVLFATLVPEGADIVYRMFGRVDFTHTRLSILAVLPLCTLFAVYLSELNTLPIYQNAHNASVDRHKAFLLIGGAATVSYLIHGTLLDYFIPRNAVRILLLDGNELMPTVAPRVLLTAALSALAPCQSPCQVPAFDLRPAATPRDRDIRRREPYLRATQDGGPTPDLPDPFRTLNYPNVDLAMMRPPEGGKLAKFKQAFEVIATDSSS